MPIDKKFIGKEFTPVRYVIGREKIKEYAKTIGDLNPLYFDEEKAKKSKYGSIIAPPMFVVVFARDAMFKLFEDKEININMERLVHGEQEFVFHKVVKENDVISTHAKIKDIFEKSKNDFVILETRSYNQQGELVVEGTWTFVIRGH